MVTERRHRRTGIGIGAAFLFVIIGVVAFGWLGASIFGAIPYVLTQALPSVPDAIFETISGFTTTGATTVEDVEALPRSILLWRSLQQWCGGLGIIMMVTILLPFMEGSGLQMLKAEAGLISQKLSPRMRGTGMMLAAIYIGISLTECLLLMPKIGWFDAVCMTFRDTSPFAGPNIP